MHYNYAYTMSQDLVFTILSFIFFSIILFFVRPSTLLFVYNLESCF